MLTTRFDRISPTNEAEREYLESLIRDEYARCRPGDSLDYLKLRAPGSPNDAGLLRDWMALAEAKFRAARAKAAQMDNGDGNIAQASRLLSPDRSNQDPTTLPSCKTADNLAPLQTCTERTVPMSEILYPKATREIADKRHSLAPEADAAFHAFSKVVFADGALPSKTKQLIAVAAAHITQCPYCITGHTKAAERAGATPQEIMEAVWVAAEMRAGAAFAHSALMLNALTPDPK
jgi:AhpD family alkylhydroperoxidase